MHLKNKNSSFQLALKRIIEESYFLKRQHDFIIYTSVFYDLNLILLYTQQKKKIKKKIKLLNKMSIYACIQESTIIFLYFFIMNFIQINGYDDSARGTTISSPTIKFSYLVTDVMSVIYT